MAGQGLGSNGVRQLEQRVGRSNGGGSGDSSDGRRVDNGGPVPRPWDMNASVSRGKPLWQLERRRVNEGRRAGENARGGGGGGRVERLRGRRREGDVGDDEDEDEQYRRRAAAAMLLGVKNKDSVQDGGGGGSSVSELGGSCDKQRRGDEGRTPPTMSPASREVSPTPGEGRKRSHRDLSGDGPQAGLSSLAPSDCGRAGARASSGGFADSNKTQTPLWFKHRGGSPSPERGMGCRPSTRRRVETDVSGGGRGGKEDGVRESSAATNAESGGREDRQS